MLVEVSLGSYDESNGDLQAPGKGLSLLGLDLWVL